MDENAAPKVGAVYVAGSYKGLYKIGFVNKIETLDRRIGEIRHRDVKISLICFFLSEHPRQLERILHEIFSPVHHHSEWFALSEEHVKWLNNSDQNATSLIEWHTDHYEECQRNYAAMKEKRRQMQLSRHAIPIPEDAPSPSRYRYWWKSFD